ncbi:MAG: valine--tRNA ligase [Candidatus Saccharibacteria bacterium]|nr:valine--tRNA ligase [Candidatus Saccharibacteria bacterium]
MELTKTYDPSRFEPNIYAMWETAAAFKPTGEGQPYAIVMPPPNANGNLHVGHALTVALQDVLTRYYRMNGRDVIYIPGADHAGFETWVVYERELNKQGKSRYDFSRDELYQNVWDFVQDQRGNMELQLRALGASCSWQDLVFTLDKKVINGVYRTFKKLWDDGLVYRGERIVNYSTKYQTSYADIEVDYKEVDGKLYKIAYPLIDYEGELVIATTRPETMFGDVAVAVNPNDERYKELIGKTVMLPLAKREIPIIADDYVDMNFGTGALKITPAHDPNDFEIGQRHNLETRQVIGFDGKMQNVPDEFKGLTVDEARRKVIETLREEEILLGEEKIKHVVGFDYKSGLPIEPLVKDQWFLKVRPLAEQAKQALINDEIKFYPDSRKRVLIQYLDNLRDWNLSRQIAWGIPIPAFVNQNDPSDWIFDTRVNQPTIEVDGKTYLREEDTFDTWFSSGQWPFLTTDYLDGGELAKFYPNSVMETGVDLLDRWVARMIMLGLYMTDQVPFKEVYMHGMVLDEHSQKMSKSKGNVVNPMEIINEFGSDALRIGVISNRSAGQNQAFSKAKVIAGRNFCNKMWNIARYICQTLPTDFKPLPQNKIKPLSSADHWILSRLQAELDKLQKYVADYRLSEAVELVYQMVWHDLADWYLEASKKQPNHQLLVYILEAYLKIVHPFAPFVTETIWQSLDWQDGLIISEQYPDLSKLKFDQQKAAEFEEIVALVEETRYLNAELPGTKNYDLLYEDDDLIADNAEVIAHLGQMKQVKKVAQGRGMRVAVSNHKCWLGVDADTLYQHQSNLEMRLLEQRAMLAKLANRLDNENYVKKAPEHLINETRQQLLDTEKIIKRLERELTELN